MIDDRKKTAFTSFTASDFRPTLEQANRALVDAYFRRPIPKWSYAGNAFEFVEVVGGGGEVRDRKDV